jgi:hypothetical protein
VSMYIQAPPAPLKEPNYTNWVQKGNLAAGTVLSIWSTGIIIDEVNNIIMTYDQNSKKIWVFTFSADPLALPTPQIVGTGSYQMDNFDSTSHSWGFNGMNRRTTLYGRYKLIQQSDVSGNGLAVFYVYDGSTLLQTIDLSSVLSTAEPPDGAISLLGTYIVIIGYDASNNLYVYLYKGQA